MTLLSNMQKQYENTLVRTVNKVAIYAILADLDLHAFSNFKKLYKGYIV